MTTLAALVMVIGMNMLTLAVALMQHRNAAFSRRLDEAKRDRWVI